VTNKSHDRVKKKHFFFSKKRRRGNFLLAEKEKVCELTNNNYGHVSNLGVDAFCTRYYMVKTGDA